MRSGPFPRDQYCYKYCCESILKNGYPVLGLHEGFGL
jgi:hypothetical protein